MDHYLGALSMLGLVNLVKFKTLLEVHPSTPPSFSTLVISYWYKEQKNLPKAKETKEQKERKNERTKRTKEQKERKNERTKRNLPKAKERQEQKTQKPQKELKKCQ